MEQLTSPKGLFRTGPPGSGKTFLADTWFASLPTPYKSRKHYNEFVLDLYPRRMGGNSQANARCWTPGSDVGHDDLESIHP